MICCCARKNDKTKYLFNFFATSSSAISTHSAINIICYSSFINRDDHCHSAIEFEWSDLFGAWFSVQLRTQSIIFGVCTGNSLNYSWRHISLSQGISQCIFYLCCLNVFKKNTKQLYVNEGRAGDFYHIRMRCIMYNVQCTCTHVHEITFSNFFIYTFTFHLWNI